MKTFEDYFKESATYYSPDNHAFKKAVEKAFNDQAKKIEGLELDIKNHKTAFGHVSKMIKSLNELVEGQQLHKTHEFLRD